MHKLPINNICIIIIIAFDGQLFIIKYIFINLSYR